MNILSFSSCLLTHTNFMQFASFEVVFHFLSSIRLIVSNYFSMYVCACILCVPTIYHNKIEA